MKVLLTGGAGFIGSRVRRELLRRGHDVRVLDSLRDDVHHGIAPQLEDDVELVHADVRDADAVAAALRGREAVCHLAAKVGLGIDLDDLPDYAGSNDYGTAVLLAQMARAGIGRLTLASSMVAYGEGRGRCARHGVVLPGPRLETELLAGRFEPPCPVCGETLEPALVGEDAALDPRNAYAASKVAQEHLSSAWARGTGGAVAALRYHNVYGPGLPRDTPYAGVAAIFLSALRRGQAPRVFEDGAQRRDFVHVDDIAAATGTALEQHGARAPDGALAEHRGDFRAFNVGSGTVRTVGDMADALARAVGGPEPVRTGDYRLGDVRHITADSARLRNEMEWRPRQDFEQGMAELAEDIR